MTHSKFGKKSGFMNVFALIAIIASLSACDGEGVNSQNENISKKVNENISKKVEDITDFDYLDVKSNLASQYWIEVFHDNKRSVTCWQTANGLSCLPDSAVTVSHK